jgi:hypothetical protein
MTESRYHVSDVTPSSRRNMQGAAEEQLRRHALLIRRSDRILRRARKLQVKSTIRLTDNDGN